MTDTRRERDVVPEDDAATRLAPPRRAAPLATDGYRDDAHAVVIGIDRYRDRKIPDLRYARADAEAVHRVLTDPLIGRFRPSNVELLLDDAATERRIRSALATALPRRALPEHTVFVYYAGHGAPVVDPRSRASDPTEKFLVPHDADADDLRASAIPMDAIQQLFGRIDSRQLIFFLDSCYSGSAGGRSFECGGVQTRGILTDEFLDGLASEGRLVVTACSAGELSIESSDKGHGLFTHYLVRGLEGAADRDGDGLVTLDELYAYLYENVDRDARALGGRMKPVRKGAVSGTVYLTQYVTAEQRRARELHALAAAARLRGALAEAESLWRDAVACDPTHPESVAALAAILDDRAREDQRRDAERERRRGMLLALRRARSLPPAYHEQALALLDRDPATLDDAERKIRRSLDLLLDDTINAGAYVFVVDRLMGEPEVAAAREASERDDADAQGMPDGLLDLLHPHLARPLPSFALVELEVDPDAGRISGGFRVPRGSLLYSRPVSGVTCRFRTCYDTTLWPAAVSDAAWTSALESGADVVRVELRALGPIRLGELAAAAPGAADGLDALRFHLAGGASVVAALHEALVAECVRVVVHDPDRPSRGPVELPASVVRPVGFADDESLLPYPRRVVRGHALLQELLAFPQKFHFVDVVGIAGALGAIDAGARAELLFVIARARHDARRPLLEMGVTAETFRLGCTPIVNLYPQTGEPLLLTRRQAEYAVVPELRRRRSIDVWSVNEVVGITPGEGDVHPIAPFHGVRRAHDGAGDGYWQADRRSSESRPDGATELFLSFVDRSGRPRVPASEVASLRLTCFDGDLPVRLPAVWGSEFELRDAAPIRRIACVARPTPVVRPPFGAALLARVVALRAFDDVSLRDEGACEALRELLRAHGIAEGGDGSDGSEGIVAMRNGAGTDGPRVELELDEDRLGAEGAFLLALVLERLLAPRAAAEGISELVVRSRRRARPVHGWAAARGPDRA